MHLRVCFVLPAAVLLAVVSAVEENQNGGNLKTDRNAGGPLLSPPMHQADEKTNTANILPELEEADGDIPRQYPAETDSTRPKRLPYSKFKQLYWYNKFLGKRAYDWENDNDYLW